MNLAILDYDGYIAKAYYAGRNKEELDNFEECYECLENMESYINNKTDMFFQGEDYKVVKIISGHTLKKDIYPTYKANRNQDYYLGIFREEIKKREEIIVAEHIEADDLIILLNENYRDSSLVFSDDKDLHKFCKWTCKINEGFQPNKEHFSKEEQLIQLMVGDSIDNIKGIPDIGEYRAKKYLKQVGYTLENVIRLYRDRKIELGECVKNILLVHPFAKGVLEEWDIKPLNINYITKGYILEVITQTMEQISKKVKEVYNEESKAN